MTIFEMKIRVIPICFKISHLFEIDQPKFTP